MSTSIADSARPTPAPRRLLIGWFAAPLAWAVHLGGGYALAGWACANGTRWLLHALTLATLLAAAGGIVANRAGRRALHHAAAPTPAVDFLRRSGALLGVLFFALIALESIPVLLAEYCA